MKTSISLAALLLGLALTAGCNGDSKKDKKLETNSSASGFALKADLCGAYLSIADFADKTDGRRQASLEIAMAVCGKMEGTDDKTWSALGARLSTPDVYVHKPDSGFTGGEKSQVFIEDESKVFAMKDSTKVLIGTITKVASGSKVKLADGITPELAIGNRLYQISDAKTVPDSEKRLFISAP